MHTPSTLAQDGKLTAVDSKMSAILPEHSNLSFRLKDNGFGFCITDANQPNCLYYEEHRFSNPAQANAKAILNALADVPSFQQPYAKVAIGIATNKFTLVPEKLFNKLDLAPYFLMGNELDPATEAAYFYAHDNGIVTVFAAEKAKVQWLSKQFTGAELKIVPTISGYIEALLNSYNLNNTVSEMIAAIEADTLLLLVKTDGKLVFCNRFAVASAEEVCYFIMMVMQQCHMHPAKDVVNFYGETESRGVIFSYLERYIAYLFVGDKPSFLSFSNAFDSIPGFLSFDLYGLHLC